MKLIVGLGNPGRFYHTTRHNLGFLVVKELARRNSLRFKKGFRSLIAKGKIDKEEVLLCQPQTYMNLSGEAVKLVLNSKNVELEDLLVVCDDLNLEFSQIRLRPKGSAGGHNGLQSIIDEIGSSQFSRLRIGIGKKEGKNKTGHVLSHFGKQEAKEIENIIEVAADACVMWLEQGIVAAMDKFNRG